MKKVCFTLLTLLIVVSIFAQKSEGDKQNVFDSIPAIVEDQILKIEFLLPGLVYETGINENSTFLIAFHTNLGLVPKVNEPSALSDFGTFVLPSITFQYRYYYNLDKRKLKLKNFTNNSGQYISTKFEAAGKLGSNKFLNNFGSFALGAVWGLQNNAKPVTFNIELGLGYGKRKIDLKNPTILDVDKIGALPIGCLNIGFLIDNYNKTHQKSILK